jgi:transcription elongation factor Elf1
LTTQKKRRALRAKADRLFSEYIRKRDGRCTRCGSQSFNQCSHHLSRRYLAVRFDPRNATTHCRSCHLFVSMRPLEHEEVILGLIGAEVYAELKRIALANDAPPDYEAVIEELKALLEGVEVGV